ncbi:MAG: hypothetical protein JWQ90_2875 [Hydrocarboniphaga sp.]|nr:hypothetical protein [Hydrocarboniphaga sp.]
MNRFALAVLALVCMPMVEAAEPGPGPTSNPKTKHLSCDAPAMPGDSREIKCAVVGTGAPGQYRFVVSFLGGHDDTSASFKAFEDGQPLVCDKNSKLSLFGEDGEVSLFCMFSLKHDAGTAHVISFSVLWSHAQYDRFEVTQE